MGHNVVYPKYDTEDTPFPCVVDGCDYQGEDGYDVEHHLRTRHIDDMIFTSYAKGEREIRYRCLFAPCTHSSAQLSNHGYHHNRHLGIRPHECPEGDIVSDRITGEPVFIPCDMRSADLASVNRHRVAIHEYHPNRENSGLVRSHEVRTLEDIPPVSIAVHDWSAKRIARKEAAIRRCKAIERVVAKRGGFEAIRQNRQAKTRRGAAKRHRHSSRASPRPERFDPTVEPSLDHLRAIAQARSDYLQSWAAGQAMSSLQGTSAHPRSLGHLNYHRAVPVASAPTFGHSSRHNWASGSMLAPLSSNHFNAIPAPSSELYGLDQSYGPPQPPTWSASDYIPEHPLSYQRTSFDQELTLPPLLNQSTNGEFLMSQLSAGGSDFGGLDGLDNDSYAASELSQ